MVLQLAAGIWLRVVEGLDEIMYKTPAQFLEVTTT